MRTRFRTRFLGLHILLRAQHFVRARSPVHWISFRAQDFVRARAQSGPFFSIQQVVANGEDMEINNKDSGQARVIGSAELRQLIPFSDAHFWRLECAGDFPRRIKLGSHRIGWDLDEVIAWIEARKSLRASDQ